MTDIAPTAPEALAWPDHFAVAHMPGSLPMGGVIPMTPIFAFRQAAPGLAFPRDHGLTPQRTDIALGGLTAFGLVGLFIGPVILAVLMAIWREWLAEKRSQSIIEDTTLP